jgi:hypothetical protein
MSNNFVTFEQTYWRKQIFEYLWPDTCLLSVKVQYLRPCFPYRFLFTRLGLLLWLKYCAQENWRNGLTHVNTSQGDWNTEVKPASRTPTLLQNESYREWHASPLPHENLSFHKIRTNVIWETLQVMCFRISSVTMFYTGQSLTALHSLHHQYWSVITVSPRGHDISLGVAFFLISFALCFLWYL